jgi:hypothetical protein
MSNYTASHIANVRALNAEILEDNKECLSTFDRERPFPWAYDANPEELQLDNYSPTNRDYAEDAGQLRMQPDPWHMNVEFSSELIDTGEDHKIFKRTCHLWLKFLNVPIENLDGIRALANNLAEIIETKGPKTPMTVIKNFAQFFSQHWPADIPRENNGEPKFLVGQNMKSICEIYGKLIHDGLKARKQFINFTRWMTRRNKFDNFKKLANIIKFLAYEIGPVGHGFCSNLVDKIDFVTDHRQFDVPNQSKWVNEYNTDINLWIFEMHAIYPLHKIVGGNISEIRPKLENTANYIRNYYINEATNRYEEMMTESTSSASIVVDENGNYLEGSFIE